MSIIISIMGATCAGKTTFIKHCTDRYPNKFASVRVGEIMRMKYPPEYFKGQNNPKHTAIEAWNLCDEMVASFIECKMPVILVDGQPRDTEQVDQFLSSWGTTPRMLILFHATKEEREKRAREQRHGDDLEKLTIPRITNDMVSYYTVLTRLAEYSISPMVVDTAIGKPGDMLAMFMLNESKKETQYVRPESLRGSWPNIPRTV